MKSAGGTTLTGTCSMRGGASIIDPVLDITLKLVDHGTTMSARRDRTTFHGALYNRSHPNSPDKP